jgi:hypothetical protein
MGVGIVRQAHLPEIGVSLLGAIEPRTVAASAAPAGNMRLFQRQPRQSGYLIRCIYSVAEAMYFGPRGFDCVCATSGPIMTRRFGAFAFGSAMPDDPQT